ncbi:MAG: fluoride efflux transporter CrcB [Alphaproteobacteria bacterium]|nr:fluoride efflux transporter CrcB [Alphaproteobacteria bacterium]
MLNVLLVAAGGAIGAVARYGTAHVAKQFFAFPVGTMVVNILGSLLIGMLMAKLQSEPAKLLLVTGVLGGFTTFSAFSWDILQLLQKQQFAAAVIYVLGSVLLSLVAVYLGYSIIK